jgi:hypothetical protein
MPRLSRNNWRSTRGLYITNLKQYLQFQNFAKYEHIYDAQLDYIIVVNRTTNDPKAMFDFAELLNYLDHIRNINALRDNNWTEHWHKQWRFTVKTLGMKFIFVKDDLDNLVIFKDEKQEIYGKIIILTSNDDISHINYKSTRIYFNCYVITNEEYVEIIKSIIGILSYYYQ